MVEVRIPRLNTTYRPIQKVITGEFSFLEISSKSIQGLFLGSDSVFPRIGRGNGPGGIRDLR